MIFRPLILVGGQSSRMGSPKYELPIPYAAGHELKYRPLLVQLIWLHFEKWQQQCSGNATFLTITLAIRDDEQKNTLTDFLLVYELPTDTTIEYVIDIVKDSGPCSALVAAHNSDENADWIVSGCDSPLLQVGTLQQLESTHLLHRVAVTCFLNEQRHSEPLIAIWSSYALRVMRCAFASAQVENRRLGPNAIISMLRGKHICHQAFHNRQPYCDVNLVVPASTQWLTNTNTPEEWLVVQPALLKVAMRELERITAAND